MAGVRGFADPNVHIAQNGKPIWFQPVINATTALLPWYINGAGGNISATQCMTAGSNSFTANHNAFAQGDNNQWIVKNAALSWGHYLRADIPTHFALADGWTVADMYSEDVVASTLPNRGQILLSPKLFKNYLELYYSLLASGSVNVPEGPQNLSQGGVVIDNNVTPGCEAPNLNCFPYAWKTYAEFLEDAGIFWQSDTNNFGDNPFAYFQQFQVAPANSSLANRGLFFLGLQAFADAIAAGTLPDVSYIIGPEELPEHPPWTPHDGGWFQQQIVNAAINSPLYNSTVLLISFDETGDWGDHVLPTVAPSNTPGEWMTNPFNTSETLFGGSGFCLPFTAISPWSRGGLQRPQLPNYIHAKGKPAVTDQLNGWRRDHMSDLTQMFDFAHVQILPDLSVSPAPLMNVHGQFTDVATCQAEFPNPRPPVPYEQQILFESNGLALSYNSILKGLGIDKAAPQHDVDDQRFILHATVPPPAMTFNLQFAGSPYQGFIDYNNRETTSISNAAVFNITDLGNGQGYTIQQTLGGLGKFLSILANEISIVTHQAPTFNIFSVTKSTDSGTGF
ncbi:hypothetical protein M422DRAFT_241856 [Sphaerobolus stellatus SS14]|nr:hypothetical protein M422DRAFT_241856 [Sphaerobolus stellatus SS14]